jgi:hypothetical protein
MNVNIVYTGKDKAQQGESVLHRLAQTLADETGWTYTRTPTGNADITYFICYVEFGEKFSDWHITPVAAWFTHHEAHLPYKHFWWQLAANNTDLRITAARQYLKELSEYGPVATVRPPIDPQFVIVSRDKHELKIVGTAGFVHPGGRKGEKLIAKLAGSKIGQHLDIKAIGRGWPCECEMLDWKSLPAWYNDLDLYICTSLIEGVPMPPLEAMACGVPVVIPIGVGMLDDLPEMPGIHRYEAGDYGSMEQAIKAGLETPFDREALRHAVADYNAANWAQDHQLAFAQMDLEQHLESDRHGKRGVCYVAYGGPSRECAKAAIASFKEHNKGIDVAVISTEPLNAGEDLFIECPDVDIGGRHAKTLIYDLAPREWEYIGYLDADTEVKQDIGFLWQALIDGWDMVICKNPGKYHVGWQMRRSDNEDECQVTYQEIGSGEIIQLNGGVFVFQRNARTEAFFHAWHDEWKKWGKRDQGALLRALYANPLKLYVLTNWPWNLITRYAAAEGHPDGETDACLLHYPMTARRWRGKVIERSDSKAAWATVAQWEKENRK